MFDMPNPNRYNILPIFFKNPLPISLFTRMAILISISSKFIGIFKDVLNNIIKNGPIDIDIFMNGLININIVKKCRYNDNQFGLSIYRTPLVRRLLISIADFFLTWNVCFTELFFLEASLSFKRIDGKQPLDTLLNKLIHSPSAGSVRLQTCLAHWALLSVILK